MAIIGYASFSAFDQSLEGQVDQLTAAGCEDIFAGQRSGTTTAGRHELAVALDRVREGDVFVVCRLDRLARSIVDLRKIIDRLTANGVGFQCLNQAAIDTTRSDGRQLLNVLASFAEFETDIRRARQREGIEKAKARGKYRGRPRSVPVGQVLALKAEGFGPTAIARRLRIGRASVYRALGGPD